MKYGAKKLRTYKGANVGGRLGKPLTLLFAGTISPLKLSDTELRTEPKILMNRDKGLEAERLIYIYYLVIFFIGFEELREPWPIPAPINPSLGGVRRKRWRWTVIDGLFLDYFGPCQHYFFSFISIFWVLLFWALVLYCVFHNFF